MQPQPRHLHSTLVVPIDKLKEIAISIEEAKALTRKLCTLDLADSDKEKAYYQQIKDWQESADDYAQMSLTTEPAVDMH